MSIYNPGDFEKKWQEDWAKKQLNKAEQPSTKPKYYVLDMFPYPSGAGLHVGHPLGYIASDIIARHKRLSGFNVLHPMGYDAFGLPAEQYAISTGQHPAITTAKNIERFREQLDNVGFSFDWSRQVNTSESSYYKWTQWIFSKFFEHWYDVSLQKARPISDLITAFEKSGNSSITAHGDEVKSFSSEEWKAMNSKEKAFVLNCYRLAFQNETTVNWCEEMGTVLANEEVVNGVSERGGYPVVRKKMKQWSLRITAYADRLILGLETLDWSDSIKEVQKNWIGRSEGAEIEFKVKSEKLKVNPISVFTTRPDTIFGATFMVIAPEYQGLSELCTQEQQAEVLAYAEKAKNRSEIDRMADTTKTGVFTGAYVINPFTEKEIPVWVSDYVLAGYGTGAIMAVPAHDERDFEFATTFNLPIVPVIKPVDEEILEPLKEAFSAKDGVCFNSGFLNGLNVKDAIKRAIEEIKNKAIGTKRVNYKLRDAGFSRQRYWGEPFPIVYNDDIPELISDLPVELPVVESYKPTGNGESPLAALTDWVNTPRGRRETNTMPGWAGSSWYFLRYMDPHNNNEFAGKESLQYWNQVDLYLGGAEHSTGHLLYSRFWTKFLYDLGNISWDEPFKKLVNQGMIMGEDGQKMSKRWGNVINPDDVCTEYGADSLRLYEMFLGPLTDSKPWNTHGIEGVSRFLGKLWRLFFNGEKFVVSTDSPTPEELKILHKTIKKVTDDMDSLSFNTSVSAFMVCVNELQKLNCNKKTVLEPLLTILSPFAPHITEELWSRLGHSTSIHQQVWPVFDANILVENSFSYPVSINGKHRTDIEFSMDATAQEMEKAVLENETVQKWLEGKAPKKVIVVKGRIVNVVV